jgi:hypothetical protein
MHRKPIQNSGNLPDLKYGQFIYYDYIISKVDPYKWGSIRGRLHK